MKIECGLSSVGGMSTNDGNSLAHTEEGIGSVKTLRSLEESYMIDSMKSLEDSSMSFIEDEVSIINSRTTMIIKTSSGSVGAEVIFL